MGKKKSKKNKSKPHNSPKPSSKRSYPYSNEQESLRTKDSYPGPISVSEIILCECSWSRTDHMTHEQII